METYKKSTEEPYPSLICSSEEALAKISRWLEDERASLEEGRDFFMSTSEYSGKAVVNILSGKMLQVLYLRIRDGTLPALSISFPKQAIMSHGSFLTRSRLVYRRTASACSLSDILEKDVPQKYFLSPKAVALIQKFRAPSTPATTKAQTGATRQRAL